jgi:hypothetical protein
MTKIIGRLGDRLLNTFAPKAKASACYCSAQPYCFNTFGGAAHQWCSYNCNCVESCGSPFNPGPCP